MRSFALAIIVVVAAAALAPDRASAQQSDQPITADLFSGPRAVRVVGDVAFAAARAGLLAYDISDRSNPSVLSQLYLDRSGSFKLAISGDLAFVLSGEIVYEQAILRIVDIGDPRSPRVVGEFSDLLPDSRVDAVHRAPADFPSGRKGDVLTVEFTLAGRKFVGLNGGPHFTFNEAVSFQIYCEDQREVDRLTALLGAAEHGHRCAGTGQPAAELAAEHTGTPDDRGHLAVEREQPREFLHAFPFSIRT